MKQEKRTLIKFEKDIRNAKKIGKLLYTGKNWAITITDREDKISNFVFDNCDYQEITRIIKKKRNIDV